MSDADDFWIQRKVSGSNGEIKSKYFASETPESDSEDEDGFATHRLKLADETPDRKSLPPQVVDFTKKAIVIDVDADEKNNDDDDDDDDTVEDVLIVSRHSTQSKLNFKSFGRKSSLSLLKRKIVAVEEPPSEADDDTDEFSRFLFTPPKKSSSALSRKIEALSSEESRSPERGVRRKFSRLKQRKTSVIGSDDDDDDHNEARFAKLPSRLAKKFPSKAKKRRIVVSEDEEEAKQKNEKAEEQGEDEEDEDDEDDEDELAEIDALVSKCESYTKALAIGGSNRNESGEKVETFGQPVTVPLKLRNYQLVGINWLALLHSKGMNGILADEMGLGKSCQTIAFLAHLMERGENGPHLIIAPASTLINWDREIARFAPHMTRLVYHGSQRERLDLQRATLRNESRPDMIVTTYNMVTNKGDRAFLRSMRLNYIVLDEAHAIKNPSSQRCVHLNKVAKKAKHRLLLTGTPLQNNLSELFSLLNFLMPSVLEYEKMKKLISEPRLRSRASENSDAHTYINRAKQILNPFILRRLKANVSTELVRKQDFVDECDMPEYQATVYRALVSDTKRSLESANASAADALLISKTENGSLLDLDADDEGGVVATQLRSPIRKKSGGDKTKTNNILMALRKLANHPLLCRQFYDTTRIRRVARALLNTAASEFADYSLQHLIEDLHVNSDFEIWRLCESYGTPALLAERPERSCLVAHSGKMIELLRQLEAARSDGVKSLVFSQMTRMLDIIEVVLEDAGIRFLRLDGSTPVQRRHELIDEFVADDALGVFLLSTRAGGLGINLTAASNVIFFDCSFNPSVERQAEDRCHRLGQEKQVTVHRLVLKGSIDQHILAMARGKRQLNDRMLDEGNFEEVEDKKKTHRQLASMLSTIINGGDQ